ncbi:hypothetical protein ACOBV8_09995 [Pseudoalteromonas espejiana]
MDLKSTWHRGVSGVDVDPIGVTNGYGLPGEINANIKIVKTDGFKGLRDISDHPAKSFIEYAVSEELVDAKRTGFHPNDYLVRQELADFLMLGGGIRQSNLAKGSQYNDVSNDFSAAINSVTQKGAALRNTQQNQAAVMQSDASLFSPQEPVSRSELAYSLMQSLALENQALSFEGDVTVVYGEQRITLKDQEAIPNELKGYVQLALDLGVMNAYYNISQNAYDLEPTVSASFNGDKLITRADYAVAITRLHKN